MTDNYPYMLIVSYGFRFVKYILHKVANISFKKGTAEQEHIPPGGVGYHSNSRKSGIILSLCEPRRYKTII